MKEKMPYNFRPLRRKGFMGEGAKRAVLPCEKGMKNGPIFNKMFSKSDKDFIDIPCFFCYCVH